MLEVGKDSDSERTRRETEIDSTEVEVAGRHGSWVASVTHVNETAERRARTGRDSAAVRVEMIGKSGSSATEIGKANKSL